MAADHLTYKKAAGLSIQGAVLQAFFTAAMLIYGILARDTAAVSASIFMGLGVAAWIALAIVYDQHRRERIEALEGEALASDAGGASVFESRGDEFRVASRRLASLYRYFLPATSIVLGTLLIGTAIWRFRAGWPQVDVARFVSSLHSGWGLGIGLLIAFVGFIFARYASGMAKLPEWQNLRAGAAFSVGSAIIALAIAIGQFIDYFGPDAVARYMIVVVPVVMGVIGIEFFLNFLLDLYRPRKPGETPRPAFDSRVLGFAAAPDRVARSISDAINYQLGFDVTGGWFYQLLRRSFLPLLGAGALVMWLLSCLAVLQPHQQGSILRFGRPVRENIGPGLHFKLPWPIDRVYVPEYVVTDLKGSKKVTDLTATGIRTINLGTSPPGTREPLLWTNDHVGTEIYQLIQAGNGDRQRGDGLGDVELVSLEVPLTYTVEDAAKYDRFAPPELRDDLLKSVAQREITLFMQTVSMQDVLGPRRAEMSDKIRQRVEAAFAQLNKDSSGTPQGTGVRVISCAIVGAHPPRDKDVAASFEKVTDAEQRYRAALDAARSQQIQTLAAAAGSEEAANALVREIEASQSASGADGKPDTAARNAAAERAEKLLEGASGAAADAIANARGERWVRHMDMRAQAARYAGRKAAFEAAPELFRVSQYFDALRSAMATSRVYITSSDIPDARVIVDLKDVDTGLDVFKPPAKD